ncbi:MAG: M12 family metallo-peptidase [Bacteroidota bacterium]
MKRVFLTVVFVLCVITGHSQTTNPLFERVADAIQSGEQFREAPSVFVNDDAPTRRVPVEHLQENRLTYLTYDYSKIPKSSKAISLEVPYLQEWFELELVQTDPDIFDYQLSTSGDGNIPKVSNALHFSGIVKDNPKSFVAISFFPDNVMGLISTPDGDFEIGRIGTTDQYVIYRDQDVKTENSFHCDATLPANFNGYDPDMLFDTNSRSSSATKCVGMHLEVGNEVLVDQGNLTAATNYIEGLFHQVAIIYYYESITVYIYSMNIWTTPDPYTGGTDTLLLLNQFRQNVQLNFNQKLGQLLVYSGTSGIGGRAYLDVLCDFDPDDRLSVSHIAATFNQFPNYTRSVKVMAHEIGHNLGSAHTHACVWYGSLNQAIDGCWTVEGSCNQPGYPLGGGTIMSYCDQPG